MTAFILIHSPLVGPLTWRPVAAALQRRGFGVAVPVLPAIEAHATEPFWARHAAALLTPDVAAVMQGTAAPVLVAHSGAGPLLPALRQRLGVRPPAAYLFVDAGLPPTAAGMSRLDLLREELPARAAGLEAHLQAGGRFPEWTDADLKDVIPDPETRRALLAEVRPQPLAFWTEPLSVYTGWPDAPFGYLQFTDGYTVPAARARQAGWPYRRLEGGHFHMLVEPAAVAGALVALLTEMGVAPAREVSP